MRHPKVLLVAAWLLLGTCWPLATLAWSNHSVMAYRALQPLLDPTKTAQVQVESMEDFLRDQQAALARLTDEQEAWARQQLPAYAPRPPALRWTETGTQDGPTLRRSFVRALRIAPDVKLALALQVDPWSTQPVGGVALPRSALDTLPTTDTGPERFVALQPGPMVDALAVLAPACDEPDYGLDINLWEDSPSAWGKEYGFGTLPFGNPALVFSTQAPFHMGFHHEAEILYRAAPFLQRTYVLLRIHQASTLAELALRTGHTYWGWRFAGWALHYLQDLTQPYHARLAPGFGTVRLLATNALAMAGFSSAKDALVVRLSNRHLALERYVFERLMRDAQARQAGGALESALQDIRRDAGYSPWSVRYPQDVVSREAADLGRAIDNALLQGMPQRYVDDPTFDFGAHEHQIDLLRELGGIDAPSLTALNQLCVTLLQNFGTHSRTLVRHLQSAAGR
jgi:hypothetical protein